MTRKYQIRVLHEGTHANVSYEDPRWLDNWHYLSGYEEGKPFVFEYADPPEPLALTAEEARYLIDNKLRHYLENGHIISVVAELWMGSSEGSLKDFGWALDQLRAGRRVVRHGWNGKGMWLVLVLDWGLARAPLVDAEDGADLAPFIAMKTADNKLVPWLASQTDMLAEDWELANG